MAAKAKRTEHTPAVKLIRPKEGAGPKAAPPRPYEIRIGEREQRVLVELCEYFGPAEVAKQIAISVPTLYRLMAGFGASAKPPTKRAFKNFFASYYAGNSTFATTA
jgi:hypothetical protein